MFEKIKRMIDTHRYKMAVKKANNIFVESGERQYILLQTDGELVVLNRPLFRKMKEEGRIPADTTIATLERECLYHTPYRNGSGEISKAKIKRKLEHYLRWKEADRQHKARLKKYCKSINK